MLFKDRVEAGQLLATRLAPLADRHDVVVLALPRGGVPVGFEVAKALKAPLDVFVVRKLGVPGQEELAMGAIASGNTRVLNTDVIHELGMSEPDIDAVAAREELELQRREHQYRSNRGPLNVEGRICILVDDGLATGSTMRGAAAALRKQQPARIIIAAPVAAPATCSELETEADEVICAVTPEPFLAIGQWYQEFPQTSDEEVRRLLEQSAEQSQRRAA